MVRWLESALIGSAVLVGFLACSGSALAELPQWNCGDDQDCVDPWAPYCDIESGECYPCLVDDHCELDQVCHQNDCILACVSDADCDAPTDYCSAEGVCFECLEDAHCPGEESLCLVEPDAGSCVECIIDEDCSEEATPWCQPWQNTCVECLEHVDCPEEQHCSQDACVPDICEPGAPSCTDNNWWVTECNEFGSGWLLVEECPDADCEDAACGGTGSTDSGNTADTGDTASGESGSEDADSGTGDDPSDSTGDTSAGATPLPGRGCGCDVEDDGVPVGQLSLILLALFGVRGRRRAS